MKKHLVIAAGGIAGSLVRYLFNESIPSYPISIFIVNLLGVAVAGMFALRFKPTEINKLFWIPGFSGSLTTFSSVTLIHGERGDLIGIAYFYLMVIISLLILWVISPREVVAE